MTASFTCTFLYTQKAGTLRLFGLGVRLSFFLSETTLLHLLFQQLPQLVKFLLVQFGDSARISVQDAG